MVSTGKHPFTFVAFQISWHGPYIVKFTLLIRLPNNRNFFFSHSLMPKLSIAILLYPFSEPRLLMSADIDTTGKPLQSNSTAQTLTFNYSVNLQKMCSYFRLINALSAFTLSSLSTTIFSISNTYVLFDKSDFVMYDFQVMFRFSIVR